MSAAVAAGMEQENRREVSRREDQDGQTALEAQLVTALSCDHLLDCSFDL
jgi:hypothetical protein